MLVLVPGCLQRVMVNTKCEWPYDNQERLDLRKAADQRRLRDEVHMAEELAIRYMDAGRRSEGEDAGRRRLRPCINALFIQISAQHAVCIDDIERARTQRNRVADVAFVIFPMSMLFVLVSNRLSKQILLPIDGRWAVVCVTLVASVFLTVVAVMFGEIWAGLVEAIRIGNEHLSFRAARIPWANQHEYLFCGGLLLFWSTTAIQYRLRTYTPDSSAPYSRRFFLR